MKQKLEYVDLNTPKICATCLHAAEVGDKQWICLTRTMVKDPEHGGQPFLVAINLYANASRCEFWVKGAEIQPSTPLLTEKEIQALRRK